MSDPYLGEIRMFAGNFAPLHWAKCDGQLLAVASYSALFSLLGTNYGGDGRSSFALPDLRGRIPVSPGTGPGLSPWTIGQKRGTEGVSLHYNEMPSHNHLIEASDNTATSEYPTNGVTGTTNFNVYSDEDSSLMVAMDGQTLKSSGSSSPHENRMCSQCLTFIIALVGTYPSRN